MIIVLVNDDLFGNDIRVVDVNDGDLEVFNAHIPAHGEQPITCLKNDSGYGNIATYQDDGPRVNRSFLHDGDRVSL